MTIELDNIFFDEKPIFIPLAQALVLFISIRSLFDSKPSTFWSIE